MFQAMYPFNRAKGDTTSNSKYEEDQKYLKLEGQGVIIFGCEKEQSIQENSRRIVGMF